jgi:hypothetical protein
MTKQYTQDEIVAEVKGWFANEDEASRKQFLEMSEDQLYGYHHGLGTHIRNHFGLWEHPWEPELREGVDYSPNHPDAISMAIIERVHQELRNELNYGNATS